jgi:hypothetical protein
MIDPTLLTAADSHVQITGERSDIATDSALMPPGLI